MKSKKSDFTVRCKRCSLYKYRTRVVFGRGNRYAEIVIIGEAPGKDEDKQGKPFVGRCGKLLDMMLRAIGLNRKEVFISNVCLCRPLNNRPPTKKEIRACRPRLIKTLKKIGKGIIIMGRSASKAVLKIDYPCWATVYRRFGKIIIPIKHPGWYLKGHMDYLPFGITEFKQVVKSIRDIDLESFKRWHLDERKI